MKVTRADASRDTRTPDGHPDRAARRGAGPSHGGSDHLSAAAWALPVAILVGILLLSLAPVPDPDLPGPLEAAPHAAAYAALMGALLAVIARVSARRGRPPWIGAAVLALSVTALGAVIEVGQLAVHRNVRVADAVANAVGVAVALVAWLTLHTLRIRRTAPRDIPDAGRRADAVSADERSVGSQAAAPMSQNFRNRRPTRRIRLAAVAIALLLLLGAALWVVARSSPPRPVAASLVATVDLSQLSPPSPDPAGIAYLPAADRFVVSDSEVDETAMFAGVNLYLMTGTGSLDSSGVTTAFSKEPTGLSFNPSDGHLFVSDDSQDRVFEVDAARDGRYGTADDVVTSISTTAFGSNDPEGVEYDPISGDLFVLDGEQEDVYRVSAGPNGRFDGVPPEGDDTVSHFDVGAFGARGPRGIAYHPSRDTLFVLDAPSVSVYEVSKAGTLITTIDISAANAEGAAGITLAPGSTDPTRTSMYIVASGVDNDKDPNESQGRLYEMAVDLPAIGTPALHPTFTP